jgi:hypothetical protein
VVYSEKSYTAFVLSYSRGVIDAKAISFEKVILCKIHTIYRPRSRLFKIVEIA